MFSTSVIIFREALEIALIVGVLLAATRGTAGHRLWITGGFALGAFGSLVLAYFADAISALAEGMGQELFNSAVLLLAALLIGWTTVWMSRHGRTLTRDFREFGRAVTAGEKPLHMLTVVTGLAVLREGSEIVLFVNGLLVSGEAPRSVALGSLFGALLGAAAGAAVYYGLIRMSVRHLFSVTSWLLVFLAAGMVLQALGYLAAGGFLPEIVPSVWDTSRLLPEQSLPGRVLHVLVGYSERPSGIQLAGYVLTVGILTVFLKFKGSEKKK